MVWSVQSLFIVASLLLATPAFTQTGAQSDPDDTEESESLTTQVSEDRLTLAVGIGDQGPFDFLIDTGSEATVVSQKLADRLGLIAEGTSDVVAISGRSQVGVVVLDELVLGSRRFSDLRAAVVDGQHIGAAGIIGIGSLQDQRVTLDFDKRMIVVAPSPGRIRAGENEIVVTAKQRHNRLIVKQATLNGRRIDVVIDTGSAYTIANTALRKRFYKGTPALAESSMTDVLGNRSPVSIINAGTLQIDRLHIENTYVAVADTRIFEELGLTERPALLLGMNHLKLFRRIAVDFRRKQISFELDDRRG